MQLILTDEEKALPMMDWDDASLGRAVKACSVVVSEIAGSLSPTLNVRLRAAALLLLGGCEEINSDVATFTFEDVDRSGVDLGPWEVIVRRKEDAHAAHSSTAASTSSTASA